MTLFSKSLARGVVRHRARATPGGDSNEPYLRGVKRDGFVIETKRRPPQPGLKAGFDVLHFDWADTEAIELPSGKREQVRSISTFNAWLTRVDKRGEVLQPLIPILSITAHAMERFIYRTGLIDQKAIIAEFAPAVRALASLPGERRDELCDRTLLLTANGSGPLERDRDLMSFDAHLNQFFALPVLVTWIPDSLLWEQNARRRARIAAAREAGKWWCEA